MKKFLLVVVLLVLACVAFIFILKTRSQETASAQQISSQEIEKLHQIARICGISENVLKEENAYNILVRMESILQDHKTYGGEFLTDEEMKILQSSFREGAPLILKIESYHRYLKSLEGKEVILLPKQ